MDRVPVMSFCEPDGSTTLKHPVLNGNTRFDLAGKNAIITGGARGIGLMAARGLLEHGLEKVALIDIDKAQGDEAVAELLQVFPGKEGSIIFRTLDVTKAADVVETIAEISQTFGGIDILATFAGIVSAIGVLDYTPENFRKVLDVNTTGTFLTAQAVAKDMVAHGRGGSIIMTASISAHMVNFPQPHAAYGTSKAAVHHLMRCMAAELAVHKIRVNSISPGYMDTRLSSSSNPALADVLPTWLSRTPMGRIGGTSELIGPLVLLASEAGSFMTGSDIVVDGGYLLT